MPVENLATLTAKLIQVHAMEIGAFVIEVGGEKPVVYVTLVYHNFNIILTVDG